MSIYYPESAQLISGRWRNMSLCVPALLLSLGASLSAAFAETSRSQFRSFTDFSSFTQSNSAGEIVMMSPRIELPGPWTELIVSWNAICPTGSFARIEARAFAEEHATGFYKMGLWSEAPSIYPRESVNAQADADGEVQTDTLICKHRMKAVQLRVTLGGANRRRPLLKFLGLSLLDAASPAAASGPNRVAWGRTLNVPERSQLEHFGANGWCSPTSISMILAYWAGILKRPEMDVPVPLVARAVNDPNWPGTGNWTFNTAWAGRFDGIRAYVARFDHLSEVEDWVVAGGPVALSVSLDLLNGAAKDEGNGHLIVVVGFTEDGDPVVNDPWPNPAKENRIRKVFPRANVVNAWKRSKNTVYLIYPTGHPLPTDRFGHWARN